jgi:hypothetical protein
MIFLQVKCKFYALEFSIQPQEKNHLTNIKIKCMQNFKISTETKISDIIESSGKKSGGRKELFKLQAFPATMPLE